MRTIARLFGKSPFAPLQTHMTCVGHCIEKLTFILSSLPSADGAQLEKKVQELSKLEHEADLTKNDIRNHLPKSLFLPMDRSHFLDILSIQDSIADQAEEIGISLTLRPLDAIASFHKDLEGLVKKSFDAFSSAREVIREIDELLESSFGGIEAERVKSMVEETARKEEETTLLQHALMKKLLREGDKLSPPAFYLWVKVVKDVGTIAELSEKLANRIRMVLELK